MEIKLTELNPVFKERLHPKALPISVKITENGCHIIASHKVNKRGYGQITRNGVQEAMHRYVYKNCKGPIPTGMVVRHSCDNTSCINPDHLILGTQTDNMQDAVDRNRMASGEDAGNSKLTKDQVRTIYESNLNANSMAEIFDTVTSNVRAIRSHRSWKQLTKNLEPGKYNICSTSTIPLSTAMDILYMKQALSYTFKTITEKLELPTKSTASSVYYKMVNKL